MNLSFLKPHAAALLFLLLVPAFLLPETTFQGKQLAQHDILQWRAGAESLIRHQAETGEQALWATNQFGGMPAYVISNVGILTSLDSLVNRYGRIIFPYVYYLFLLTGAYVFLLSFGCRPLAAVFGATLIGVTTYIPVILGAGHNTKFYAYTWLPWLLVGFHWILRNRLLQGGIFFLFFLSLHLRAGHPQVTYYFLFLMAIWWVAELVAAIRAKDTTPILKQTGVLAAGVVIALMTVLPQYWALNEYSTYSIRGGSAMTGETGLDQTYAFVWSQGWGELLTLVVPNLYGGGGELYWGPKPVTSGPHYLGVFAALFFLVALFGKKDRTDRIFIGAGAVGMLFSLGNHFGLLNNLMFAYFPAFDKFRTPEMWLMMTCFAWAVPAARAFDRDWSVKSVVTGGGALLGLALLAWMSVGTGSAFERDGERTRIQQQIAQSNNVSPEDPRVRQAATQYLSTVKPKREDAAKSDFLRLFILGGIGLGLMTAVVRKSLKKEHAAIAMVLVSGYDLVSVGKRYIPESAFQPRVGDMGEVLRAQTRDIDRWLADHTQTGEGWSYRVLPLSENPFNNAIPSFHYASLGGYSGAKLRSFQDIVDHALFTGPAGIHIGILNMMNVKYITYNAPVQLPGFELVHESEGTYVLENRNVMPKAWFADRVMTVATEIEAMEAVTSVLDDARSVAVVQSATPIETDSGGTAIVTEYGPHRIVVKTEHDAGGFLVLGEVFYPAGWSATVDGVPAEILPTNYLLRGLRVPAGGRQVVLTFEPAWLAPVSMLSDVANGLAILVFFGAGIILLVRRGSKA